MEMSAFQSAITGMSVNATRAAVAAHNIANVNTDGFKKSSATISANAAGPPEVQITQSETPGPLIQNYEGLPDSAEVRELSNVDLVEEFIQLKLAEVGYKASAAIISTEEEMLGSILDIIV